MRRISVIIVLLLLLVSAGSYAQRTVGLYSIYDCRTSSNDYSLHYLTLKTFPNGRFECNELTTFEDLLKTIDTGRDLVVMVHGYGVNLKKFSKRIEHFSYMYDVDLLTFFWPSMLKIKPGSPSRNFNYTKESIEDMQPYFNDFVKALSAYCHKTGKKCSMIYLSLGNTFAMNMGREIGTIKGAPDLSFVSNLLLNESCVPLRNHEKWVEPLAKSIHNKLYIVTNANDQLLELDESLYSSGRNLGRGPQEGDAIAPSAIYQDNTDLLENVIDPFFSHMYYLGPFRAKTIPIYNFYKDAFHGL